MNVIETALPGVLIIEPKIYADDRGHFFESFNHAAFEVRDLDDLMAGHDHLKAGARTPAWGVGRHILGSQVFDYWRDPWGHILEHWTDGDLLTAAEAANTATLQDLLGVQWGPPSPPDFG